jgi:hypothetical protein
MIGLIWFVLAVLASPFKSKVRSHNHPARGAGALAQGRFSPSLALEITGTGRPAADWHTFLRVSNERQFGDRRCSLPDDEMAPHPVALQRLTNFRIRATVPDHEGRCLVDMTVAIILVCVRLRLQRQRRGA